MSSPAPPSNVSRESSRPIGQVFGLLSATLVVLSILYGIYALQEQQSQSLRSAAAEARIAALSVETNFAQQASVLRRIAREGAAAGGNLEAMQRLLIEAGRSLPMPIRWLMVSPEGEVLNAAEGHGEHLPAIVGAEIARRSAPLQGIRVLDDVAAAGHRSGNSVLMVLRDPAVEDVCRGCMFVARMSDGHESAWLGRGLPEGIALGVVTDSGMVVALGGRADTPAAETFDRVTRHARAHGLVAGGELPAAQWFDFSERPAAYQRVRGQPLTIVVEVSHARLWSLWLAHVQVPLVLFALALFGLVFASAWTHRQQRAREVERDAAAALLKRQASELRRRAVLLSHTQRAAGVGGWEIELATGELFWTEETYRLHETTPGQFTPTVDGALAFYTPESRELVRGAMEQSMRSGQAWDVEVELVTARGRHIWVRVTGQAELAPSGLPARVSGSFQDVSERHRSDERIRRLAHYDELTGLPNRNLFMHHLTHAIARAERYHKGIALLFVDLDRFKVINDSLGHDLGDTVLKAIGQRLAQSMRAADLVARLGGDEYVVVAEELDAVDDVTDVARKLKGVLEQPVVCQGHELVLSGSIGISLYPQDGRDAQQLLKHADIAMYRAKEQGKNRYEFYSHSMGVIDINRLSMEATLRKAVADMDQFVLHYQPKLSVVDGHITGAEALVRWMSPERGLVPPADFIPLAEETGLIAELGEWVLRTACAQAALWARKGLPPIRVAVNLSARQIYGAGFVEMVRKVLADTGVRAGCVELELTESVMMQDIQHVADLLTELKVIGVHVSVDDFGTGYSSLSYLKRLPLDALKVDRSFVRDVPSDPDDAAITRAVVALAHSLRLKVVAEGVETEAQLAFLRELGCDEIQGFIFSRPVVASEFEDMLRRDLRLAHDARLDAA